LENSTGAPAGFCAGAGMKCNIGSLVSPIANNGGTAGTRTLALLAGSPAINAGGAVLGALITDQRGTGFSRVNGGTVDMGAFESDVATLTGCTLDPDATGGNPDALTDGLLLMRAMFGLTGNAVTTGALGASPGRNNWTAIRNYLNANCGTTFAQ
ncbi:MAG: choice-of-anchor Q domain-containing protein, partial [Betaproteobacteria bacterium]